MRLARPVRIAARSKYHAKPTVVDGIRFASKRESERYMELKILAQAGAILTLRLQPRFPLYVQPVQQNLDPVLVGTYVADFAYETVKLKTVIEDVKGVRTPLYRMKKKMAEALYGIEIREIR